MTTPRIVRPLVVLEIGTGLAAAYAGWLLARMGAAVSRVAAASPELPEADPAGSALQHLSHGKTRLESTDGQQLLAACRSADLVLTDDRPAFERLLDRRLPEIAEALSGTVVGVASIFGLSGPLADAPATELEAQAVAGVSWVLGEAGREPLSIPPGILPFQAGVHLAAASLMALVVPPPAGPARIVDIALADVLASYVGVNCRFLIHHGLTWERAGRRASGSGGAYPFVILPCRDGDVCLSGRTRDEWNRFVKAMGDPAWAAEPRYQNLRAMGRQYPEEVDALILPWLAERSKAEIGELASRFNLTISPVRTFAEVLATPQFAERRFFEDATVAGRSVKVPGLPFRAGDERAPEARDGSARLLADVRVAQPVGGLKPARPLAGLRILDLGWVWSAPQVGGILAQFGAEVIKVEHGGRPDNTRLSGRVFKNGQTVEGVTTEMSPMYHQINRGKLGLTLNMKEPRAVELARELARTSDIVLENMSPGAIERTGLGYGALRSLNPRTIMLAMSGAGQFGPLADMRTYAPVMSSFVGLEALVGYAGEPSLGALMFALGDPNAALHGLLAALAALLRRDATGEGCYIDLSQTEALLATLSPYLLSAQISGQQPPTSGNAHPDYAPRGIYPAAGTDRWLSVSVTSDAQWQALAGLLAGEWAMDGKYRTAAGRLADRAALDGALAGWSRHRDRDDLVRRLREAGVPAAPVQSIEEIWRDPQYGARRLTDRVELPYMGEEDLFRPPWLFSDLAPAPAGRGPGLGEHNRVILTGRLGLSDAEIDDLVANGAVA